MIMKIKKAKKRLITIFNNKNLHLFRMLSTSRVDAVFELAVGLCAEEIHVCGEPAAIDFIRELLYTTGEEVEVRQI